MKRIAFLLAILIGDLVLMPRAEACRAMPRDPPWVVQAEVPPPPGNGLVLLVSFPVEVGNTSARPGARALVRRVVHGVYDKQEIWVSFHPEACVQAFRYGRDGYVAGTLRKDANGLEYLDPVIRTGPTSLTPDLLKLANPPSPEDHQ